MQGAAGLLDPQGLMLWLARQPAGRGLCIECGAGRAEIGAFMARAFGRVIACDIRPIPVPSDAAPRNLERRQAPAEAIPADDRSADLVVSMQALHFFDRTGHLAEVRRVLRPGGVFAALAWGEMLLPGPVAAHLAALTTALAAHWEPARAEVVAGYPDLHFAGKALALPAAAMVRAMTLAGILAEISGWSAARRARAAGMVLPAPVPALPGLTADARFAVAWPIVGRVFRTAG